MHTFPPPCACGRIPRAAAHQHTAFYKPWATPFPDTPVFHPPPTPPPLPARSLRQLKAARKLLRDYNATSAQQLQAQLGVMEEAGTLIGGVRADLDHVYARIRWVLE